MNKEFKFQGFSSVKKTRDKNQMPTTFQATLACGKRKFGDKKMKKDQNPDKIEVGNELKIENLELG